MLRENYIMYYTSQNLDPNYKMVSLYFSFPSKDHLNGNLNVRLMIWLTPMVPGGVP